MFPFLSANHDENQNIKLNKNISNLSFYRKSLSCVALNSDKFGNCILNVAFISYNAYLL